MTSNIVPNNTRRCTQDVWNCVQILQCERKRDEIDLYSVTSKAADTHLLKLSWLLNSVDRV